MQIRVEKERDMRIADKRKQEVREDDEENEEDRMRTRRAKW